MTRPTNSRQTRPHDNDVHVLHNAYLTLTSEFELSVIVSMRTGFGGTRGVNMLAGE